jgi:hypothetical protein
MSDRRKVGMSLLECHPHFLSTPGRLASIYLRYSEDLFEWIHANMYLDENRYTNHSLPNQVSRW